MIFFAMPIQKRNSKERKILSDQFSKIQGLVVRSAKQGDCNRILKIATENGDIDAIVYTCAKPKSPLIFLNEPFIYADFELKKGKGDLPQISSANLIKNFYNIRLSIEKVEIAAEICRIVEKTIVPNEDFPLPFVLNTLHILESADDQKSQIILPFFTLRLLNELGFPIDISINDQTSSRTSTPYMACAIRDPQSVRSTTEESSLFTHIQSSPISRLYNAHLAPETLSELTLFAKSTLENIISLK